MFSNHKAIKSEINKKVIRKYLYGNTKDLDNRTKSLRRKTRLKDLCYWVLRTEHWHNKIRLSRTERDTNYFVDIRFKISVALKSGAERTVFTKKC